MKSLKFLIASFIGSTFSLFCLIEFTQYFQHPLIMAPFGASCVLLYCVPQSPLAQPKNLILGHLISATIGLLFLKFLGTQPFCVASAVGCAILLMQFFDCVHPPAGANPLLILLTASSVQYEWSFLIFPVFIGSLFLVIVAKLTHHLFKTA